VKNKHRKLARAKRREIRMRLARTVFIHDEVIYATPEDARVLMRMHFRALSKVIDGIPPIPIKHDTARSSSFSPRGWNMPPPPTGLLPEKPRFVPAVNNLVQGAAADATLAAERALWKKI
jgi:hypothetical protein